ncbi:hypothetical protein CHISP_2101 [Chitinispirillum alkaliphilum]|nr:hypothetical protein CHISP_2101 [Chitinispirillum alkaliphilum]
MHNRAHFAESPDETQASLRIRDVLRTVRSYLLHFIILCLSVAVIVVTWIHFSNRMEKRRFLTTTRLSILHRQVQRACRYVEKNYGDKELSGEKICEELVTGEAFLEALFHKDLGIGVADFINQVRVNNTKILLSAEPEISEEKICEKCGFADRAELERAFRKITGVSVKDYMKNMQSQNL